MIDLSVLAGDWSEKIVPFSKEEGGWIGFETPRPLLGVVIELTSFPNLAAWRNHFYPNRAFLLTMRLNPTRAFMSFHIILTWSDGKALTTKVSNDILIDVYKASRGWL